METTLRPTTLRETACVSAIDSRRARFVDDVCSMHDVLRFRRLVAAIEASSSADVYVARRHGVVTIAARTRDIPARYLVGLLGFRLAEYLRVGFACKTVTAKRALFAEPAHVVNPDDWHVVALDERTGQILGYVELVGPAPGFARVDRGDDADRPFPVEQSHRIDILSAFGARDRHSRSSIREVKRFLHRGSMTDRGLRLRVSLECLLALARVVEGQAATISAIIGDAESHVALRHVVLLGLDVRVLAGTEPRLPDEDLMHPAYVTRADVKPFFAELPGVQEIRRRSAVIEQVVDNADIFAEVGRLAEEMQGSVESVAVTAPAA
jgi:hypothetical protein